MRYTSRALQRTVTATYVDTPRPWYNSAPDHQLLRSPPLAPASTETFWSRSGSVGKLSNITRAGAKRLIVGRRQHLHLAQPTRHSQLHIARPTISPFHQA